jgi:preprotein translocase subunit SecD
MKSITYIIAVFFCGIIATGFVNGPQTTHTILLQSTDTKTSSITLLQSADIITRRLKAFSNHKFEIKTIPEKNQIQILLSDNQDLKIVESLITQKGSLEFFETYDYQGLTKLLKGDSTLIKLLHTGEHYESSSKIGCTSAVEMNAVVQYLNTIGLSEKCKFAWSNFFDDSDVCLYALRIEDGARIPLTGNDIQSFELKQDASRQKDNIVFKFKTPAIQIWADVTKRNINRAIAIVMDNNVLYAPVVREEINGGNCEISGDFTHIQVQYIAAIGANGKLPVNFTIVK